jgi:hypothetical protein
MKQAAADAKAAEAEEAGGGLASSRSFEHKQILDRLGFRVF